MSKITLIIFVSVVCLTSNVLSQKKELSPITADSLATGNYKDVLNSFFQLGFERVTGPNKEIKFTSNPYAVMARLDTNMLLSSQYYKHRKLRDFNFAVSVKLDSSYKFGGFSSALKYALINKRDETVSWAFVSSFLGDETIKAFFTLNSFIIGNVSTYTQDRDLQKQLIDEANQFMKGELKFSKLNIILQTGIKQFLREKNLNLIEDIIDQNKNFNPAKISTEIYDNLKDVINNKLLWTVGISDTTYSDQFMFSHIVLSTDLVKGIDKMKRADIELNINANLQFTDDTLRITRDLKRSIFTFEPGFNFVAKTKATQKSFLEFKLSGGYYYTFSGLYAGEEKSRMTLNGTLRVRVYNDIWVPLEIKYDPKTGNVFGLLNVRANFTALKGFVNK
jgi:hypothetical protein